MLMRISYIMHECLKLIELYIHYKMSIVVAKISYSFHKVNLSVKVVSSELEFQNLHWKCK
jgi:hypothetical protein